MTSFEKSKLGLEKKFEVRANFARMIIHVHALHQIYTHKYYSLLD